MKKKLMSVILCLACTLALLTGCGGGSGGSGSSGGSGDSGSSGSPAKLTLSLWDEAQLPVIQENVDKFNAEHAGSIEVTIEQIPWDTYWTKLDASLETNEAPDVFWMNTYVHKYVEAGVLESLESYIAAENFDLSVYAEGRLNAYNVGGEQYALPKGLDSVVVALNTELFSRYNVALPQDGWTWDDMRSIADQLRDAIAAAGGSEYPIVMELDAQPSWMNFLYQNGGCYLKDGGKTCGIAEDASKDAVQQVVDLMTNGQMAPYSVLSETPGTDLFISGQAAMVFIGSWKSSVLEGSTLGGAGNIQLIQMPAMSVDNHSSMGGLGYTMSKRCANKEAAWEFLKYITGKEALSYEAEKGIDMPAYLEAQSAYVANFKNINAQVFMDATVSGFAYPSNGNFDWVSTVNDAMQEAFAQAKTVDAAMEDGAAKAQTILDQVFG